MLVRQIANRRSISSRALSQRPRNVAPVRLNTRVINTPLQHSRSPLTNLRRHHVQQRRFLFGFEKQGQKLADTEKHDVELFTPSDPRKRKATAPPSSPSLMVPYPETAFVEELTPQAASAQSRTQVTILGNDITVATVETGSQMSAITMFVLAGPRFESEELYGTTVLLERLAFKSTNVRTAAEMTDVLDYMGASVSTTTSRDLIVYSAEILREHVDKMVMLLAETIQQCKFDAKEIEEQISTLEYDYEKFLEEPDQFIPAVLHETGYQGDLFGRPLLPDPKLLQSLTVDQLRNYLQTYYVGSRIVISAAGVDHKEFVKLVQTHFGNLPRFSPGKLAKEELVRPVYSGGETRLALEELDLLQDDDKSRFCLGFECPGAGSEDFVKLYTLQTMMGGGSSFSSGGPGKGIYSRLYTQALNKFHWLEHMEAIAQTHIDTGIFSIYGATDKGSLFKGLEVAVDQLVSVANKVGEAELARARNMLKTSMFINLESRHLLADDIGRQICLLGKRYEPEQLVKMIDSVTTDDIKSLVRRILSSPPTVVYVAPAKELKQLPAYDTLKKHFGTFVRT